MKRLLPLLLAFALSSDAGLMTKGIKNPAAAVTGPWTTTKLGSDFSTAATTATNVTGLNTTVLASTKYEFDMWLELNSSTTAGLNLTIDSDDATSTIAAVSNHGTTAQAASLAHVQALSTNIGVQSTYSTGDTMTHIVGEFKSGASATLLRVNVLKVTSGTAIVRAGSKVHIRKQTTALTNGWGSTFVLSSDCTNASTALTACSGFNSTPGVTETLLWEGWLPVTSSTTAGMSVSLITGGFNIPGQVATGGTTGGTAVITGNYTSDTGIGNFATVTSPDQFVHIFGITGIGPTTVVGIGQAKTTSGTATIRAGARFNFRTW
jgi:hypothetical protein